MLVVAIVEESLIERRVVQNVGDGVAIAGLRVALEESVFIAFLSGLSVSFDYCCKLRKREYRKQSVVRTRVESATPRPIASH